MRNLEGAAIVAAVEVPYARHPDGSTTGDLLARAFGQALAEAGVAHGEVDGLGVSSFTLGPDHAVDLAWRFGIAPRWLMDDCLGGASGIDLLQHAVRAIQAGDAKVVVLVAGDRFEPADFTRLTEHYNFQANVGYNIVDSFAVELRAGWAYSRNTSLTTRVREQLLATSVGSFSDVSGLWRMSVNGAIGARWQPIYGKISLVAEVPVHFQLYLWAGAGGALLDRESAVLCTQPVRGAMNTITACNEYLTEQKFAPVVSLAAGFRFFINEHHVVRIELRDWSYFDSYFENVPASNNGAQGGTLASSPGITNVVLIDLGYSFIF